MVEDINRQRRIKRQISFNPDKIAGATLSHDVAVRAAKAVALKFRPEFEFIEALEVLDMLGLIEPLPGNEPKTQREYKKERNLESKEQKRLDKYKVTPEEIGEEDDDDVV